jgi:cyclase
VWVLALALLAGCGARGFLHLDRRTFDGQVRVWLGGGGNSTVVMEGSQALVVDPKMLGFARRLRKEVEEDLGRSVRRLVLTHSHYDHAGGAGEFRSVGAVLVHPRARARLAGDSAGGCRPGGGGMPEPGLTLAPPRAPLFESPGQGRVRDLCALPYVEVAGEVTLWLGGEEVRVWHPGVGHTDGDLVAYLPSRRLLVAGDLAMNGWLPRVDPQAGGNPLAFWRTLDAVLELEFDSVVPGHGDIGGREIIERSRDYLRALEGDVRQARADGLTEDQAASRVGLRAELKGTPPLPTESHSGNVRLVYRALVDAETDAPP